jgi:hypothetical protein
LPSPTQIFIIRHAEKPEVAPPSGIDFDGVIDPHSLTPRGWQRSGALAVLFASRPMAVPSAINTPTDLFSPGYPAHPRVNKRRTYQTLLGIAGRLQLPITTDYQEGQEDSLARAIVSTYIGTMLICWEHSSIPKLTSAFPLSSPADVPASWPEDRFDVIWSLTAMPSRAQPTYSFSQIPQLVLPGDKSEAI